MVVCERPREIVCRRCPISLCFDLVSVQVLAVNGVKVFELFPCRGSLTKLQLQDCLSRCDVRLSCKDDPYSKRAACHGLDSDILDIVAGLRWVVLEVRIPPALVESEAEDCEEGEHKEYADASAAERVESRVALVG